MVASLVVTVLVVRTVCGVVFSSDSGNRYRQARFPILLFVVVVFILLSAFMAGGEYGARRCGITLWSVWRVIFVVNLGICLFVLAWYLNGDEPDDWRQPTDDPPEPTPPGLTLQPPIFEEPLAPRGRGSSHF